MYREVNEPAQKKKTGDPRNMRSVRIHGSNKKKDKPFPNILPQGPIARLVLVSQSVIGSRCTLGVARSRLLPPARTTSRQDPLPKWKEFENGLEMDRLLLGAKTTTKEKGNDSPLET